MRRLRLALYTVGVALLVAGFHSCQERGIAKQWSQGLDLAQLIERGPGDNAHIELTDFFLCDHDFVYSKKRGEWSSAWVPAFPKDSAYAEEARDASDYSKPKPRGFRTLVYFARVKGRSDIQAAARQTRLDGVVTNKLDPLDGETRDFLRETYPGLDLEKTWIFEAGRKPPDLGNLGWTFLGAFLFLAAGGIWTLLSRRRTPPPVPPVFPPPPRRPVASYPRR